MLGIDVCPVNRYLLSYGNFECVYYRAYLFICHVATILII